MEAELSINKPVKKPRGRPAKYSPEERQEKYKEASRLWKQEHKEQCNEHHKVYYRENSEFCLKQSYEYQARARNALRLLSEMLDNDFIQIKDEKYKLMANDLIKNKKIIYT